MIFAELTRPVFRTSWRRDEHELGRVHVDILCIASSYLISIVFHGRYQGDFMIIARLIVVPYVSDLNPCIFLEPCSFGLGS